MKQHNRGNRSRQQPLPPWASAVARQDSHRLMNRICRRFIILILSLLVIASILAGLAAFQPWVVTWHAPVLQYERSQQVDYRVLLKPDAIPGVDEAPSDAFYLDELVAAVEPTFYVVLTTDRPVNAQVHARLEAVIQAREPGDNQPVLLQVVESVLDDQVWTIHSETLFQSGHVLLVDLDPYRENAEAIAARLDQPLVFELLLHYNADFELDLRGGPVILNETVTLQIPLNQAVFNIERSTSPSIQPADVIRQQLHYRIHFNLFPWPIFLAAAILSLISLLLLLLTTRGRPKDPFMRRLRRMQKQVRGRMILIGDKAWDPAWCVKVTDFASMARTACKLKHPVFCYIDNLSAWPVAYFYTYYGENNYCHIYTEHPDMLDEAFAAASADDETAEDDENDYAIPVLPEDDALPPGGKSAEIKISRPDRPLQADEVDQQPYEEDKPSEST